MTELTRFDLKNQALMERIADALERIADQMMELASDRELTLSIVRHLDRLASAVEGLERRDYR